MDNSGLRKRVAQTLHNLGCPLDGATNDFAVNAILSLIDAEYRPLLDAAEATLAVLECGVDPGPHHMDSLDGRIAWIDRMRPVRERLRVELEARRSKP